MADILLLHPKEPMGRIHGKIPPLGMEGIASFLESAGYAAELVDFQISSSSPREVLDKYQPRIVGIGGTSHTRHESFNLAKTVKSHNPAITVIYGGVHASFTAEDTLSHIPEIDIIVRGEGEYPTLLLARSLLNKQVTLDKIDGISFRENGNIVHNQPSERIVDLDSLPLLKRDPDEFSKYDLELDFLGLPATAVVTSRGCNAHCSFCAASALFGKGVIYRSASNVVDEIELLLSDFGVRGIKFFDSTFTSKPSHVQAICDEIRARNLVFPWECEIRAEGITKGLLKTMKNAGCYYVDMGVESAVPHVIKAMKKRINNNQVTDVLRWCKELGIKTKVFFTFGHIGETFDDALETVNFIKDHRKNITVLGAGSGIRIYPGTPVEDYARQTGCLGEEFTWTASYSDNNALKLARDPFIPLLIQSQMGWDELKRITSLLTVEKLRRYSNPFELFRFLRTQISQGNFTRLWGIFTNFLTSGMVRTAKR